MVAAIAKDGIELRAKARVTESAPTSTAWSAAQARDRHRPCRRRHRHHRRFRRIPQAGSRKSRYDLPHRAFKGLDAGTAFEILSIDIADVDVGRNIGAQLQMDQAEADKRIAQAKAEERRAMAVAHEQEMMAAVQEMRAKVVEAEAEVPRAMAAALREGKLGVMDYYNMQNVIADTQMRDSIAHPRRLHRPPSGKTARRNAMKSIRKGGGGRGWTV